MSGFKISGTIAFGPRKEKPTTTGASKSLTASVFNISATGVLVGNKDAEAILGYGHCWQ